VIGAALIALALYRYRIFSKDSPESDIPKFALAFGVGWLLIFVEIVEIWAN